MLRKRGSMDKIIDAPQKQLGSQHFTLVSSKKVPFTLKLAQEVVDMPEFVGERPMKVNDALHLGVEMEDGLFCYEDVIIQVCRCKYDGVTRRVNGQHTCVARSMFGEKLPNGSVPKVTYNVYEVETEADFRLLYAKKDRGIARTPTDISRSRLVGTPEYGDVPESVVRMLAPGYKAWVCNGVYAAAPTTDEACDALLTHHCRLGQKVVPLIHQICNDRDVTFLKRAAITGAIFATCDKCHRDSVDFWDAVITGLNFTDKRDPRKVLRDWQASQILKTGTHTSAGARKTCSQEACLRGCLLAWNAFREGRTLNSIRVGQLKGRPTVK